LPRQTVGLAPRQSCRNQAGLVFRPAGLLTFLFAGAATRRSRNRFPTRRGGFCTPGTGGAITGATDTVLVSSMGTATEVGPLTSSPPSRGQSSGGALWIPGYTPTDRLTSWGYSITLVQYLYISCYLSVNKPVLSYLSSRLLPQYRQKNAWAKNRTISFKIVQWLQFSPKQMKFCIMNLCYVYFKDKILQASS
jgi:hypothetical protein